MNKLIIDEVLASKPITCPRIYAHAIADAAHYSLLKVGQTTRDVKRRVAQQLKPAAIPNFPIERDEPAERGHFMTSPLPRSRRLSMGMLLASLMLGCTASLAQTINPAFGERIEGVKNDKLFPVSLQVTVFQPEGPGPFPVAIINHGKETGNVHLQARYRPWNAVREFLKRGYVVIVPMRQGFAGSGGSAVGEGCNTGGNGNAQAEDIVTVVRWLGKQAWADTHRMLMLGQSHGGLTTIAYSQAPDPGFKLFVNFAGGLKRTESGCLWELALKDAFAGYGAKSKTPSIWFYGENDSYFPPHVIAPAFKAFVDAGGKGELVAYGAFSTDAHAMFSSADGLTIWLDKVLAKMDSVGLPTAVVLPSYGFTQAAPAATGYADLADVTAAVKISPALETPYRNFLQKPLPRAFVVAPQAGKHYYLVGGENPLQTALAGCEKKYQETCLPYAVDDRVVWQRR